MRFLIVVFLCLLCTPDVRGQATADSVMTLLRVEMSDGSSYLGELVSEGNGVLVLRTLAGREVELQRSEIESRREVKGRLHNGRFVVFDPNSTRLFFSPTARALGKGHGYFADYWLFLGQLAYGVTDRVALSGGGLLFPGTWDDFFYVAPKVTLIEQGNSALAAGAFAGFVTEDWLDDGIGTFGILYGAYTRGYPDKALTVGVGFAFAEGSISSSPTITIGFERGLSRRTKFISENWIFPSAELILYSGGIRFYGSHLAADVGLVGASLGGGTVPWVGFAYNFD